LRRLEGISYWVIEDPDAIYDFINTEVRKEWEEDVKSFPGDPASGVWLETLPKRRWRLDTLRMGAITLDESVMNYVDGKSGYNFAERLAKRRQELGKDWNYGGVLSGQSLFVRRTWKFLMATAGTPR
jgi:hypothetical protein